MSEEPLWRPSPERVERAVLSRYIQWVAERHGVRHETYESLWRWSVADLETFWAGIWDFFDVRASVPYERVLRGDSMPGAEWFVGARLNYAEHVLRHGRPGEVAVVHADETGAARSITWDALRDEVASVAGGLRELGVGPGDAVAAFLPNVPETLVAFLACASLGATWSCCSPDFGARSVADRFRQIAPKALFAVDGYRYGGSEYDRLDVVRSIQDAIPSLAHVVLLPVLRGSAPGGATKGLRSWEDLVAAGRDQPLRFEQVPSDHPLWVVYSSGTTGAPKGIVHGHGGTLVEHLKNAHLQMDLGPEDRAFWFTTSGWMVWNVLMSYLLTGASIVTFDGNPLHPDADALWDVVERTGVTFFGTSPPFLAACMREGMEPGRDHDLSAVRTVGSSGSPLSPEGFRWVYDHVASDVWLASNSGGTDICSSLLGGIPILPVFAGELQARMLGVALEAWDDQGRAVVDQVGELVVTKPMPSMPLRLCGDPDGARYRESYFDVYPGIWRHGDWVRITERGSGEILGRSDATINRYGVRVGSAEIYRAVLADPDVVDALVVDVPRGATGSWVPLFVVLADGIELQDSLAERLRQRIRSDCSPRHVPNAVYQIDVMPRTLTGKKLEVPVKRILMGTPIDEAVDVSAVQDPDSLQVFARLARDAAG